NPQAERVAQQPAARRRLFGAEPHGMPYLPTPPAGRWSLIPPARYCTRICLRESLKSGPTADSGQNSPSIALGLVRISASQGFGREIALQRVKRLCPGIAPESGIDAVDGSPPANRCLIGGMPKGEPR